MIFIILYCKQLEWIQATGINNGHEWRARILRLYVFVCVRMCVGLCVRVCGCMIGYTYVYTPCATCIHLVRTRASMLLVTRNDYIYFANFISSLLNLEKIHVGLYQTICDESTCLLLFDCAAVKLWNLTASNLIAWSHLRLLINVPQVSRCNDQTRFSWRIHWKQALYCYWINCEFHYCHNTDSRFIKPTFKWRLDQTARKITYIYNTHT